MLIDVIGLCVTARNENYIKSALAGWGEEGPCTVIGHSAPASAAAAAFVNGTAAHGEDFDDTFEGGPVHAGAVIVPAVLAICEQQQAERLSPLLGIAVGVEVLCRLSLVVPKAIHRAGFHPTAVLGTMAAAAGVGVALRLKPEQMVNALGIAGSMAGGIIEYLAEGAWTKRLHPGWAAQSGLRAALLGRANFVGPRTVFEGTHGLFHGFAHTQEGDYAALLGDFGERWVTETLAFKPYPCGTMIHPYIDCARRLAAKGIAVEDTSQMVTRLVRQHQRQSIFCDGRVSDQTSINPHEPRRPKSPGLGINRWRLPKQFIGHFGKCAMEFLEQVRQHASTTLLRTPARKYLLHRPI